jgi:hypothetical protein
VTSAKNLFGIVLCIGGIAFGLYAGIWWAFIGGIVDVISAIRATNLEAMSVAMGVAKILFAAPIGWLAASVLVFPGYAMTR